MMVSAVQCAGVRYLYIVVPRGNVPLPKNVPGGKKLPNRASSTLGLVSTPDPSATGAMTEALPAAVTD